MTPRWLRMSAAGIPLLIAAGALSTSPAPVSAAPAATLPARPTFVDGVADTGQFLPDTTTLLRVDGRVTRVRDFVVAYFASYAEFRPAPDSLGRLEFLNSLVQKEILALTALAARRPLAFEDRAVLREYRERVLANATYQRTVLDSLRITEAEVRRVYEQYGRQQQLRFIRCAEAADAGRVRAALVANRLAWKDAVRLHHRPLKGEPVDGELGWITRGSFTSEAALEVFELPPGGISTVMQEPDGHRFYQAVARRPVAPPAYVGARRKIMMDLKEQRAAFYSGQVQQEVARSIDIRYDSTNIAWAAPRFDSRPLVESGDAGQLVLNLEREVPHFADEDAGRVLASHRDGQFTLGQFIHVYDSYPPQMRPVLSGVEGLRDHLEIMVIQPYLARMAETRGFDRDSAVVAQLARREEQLRVEHLYDDSVSNKVVIEPADRRRFYQENLHQLVTYPSVRFAAILRGSQAAADSLLARIRGGERAEDVLRADSLAGIETGSIQERRQNDQGPFHKVLFEELRPGQARIEGPDRDGRWVMIQSLSFDPGRQLSYDESQHYVDDALRNARSEALLQALIARHRPRHRIEAHPELLMRVRLSDPTLGD